MSSPCSSSRRRRKKIKEFKKIKTRSKRKNISFYLLHAIVVKLVNADHFVAPSSTQSVITAICFVSLLYLMFIVVPFDVRPRSI